MRGIRGIGNAFRVRRIHSASSNGHTRWYGKVVLVALLALRTIPFAAGCKSTAAAGSEGGNCGSGCTPGCDSGLRCDTSSDTCVADGQEDASPAACVGAVGDCPAGIPEFSCPIGVSPGPDCTTPSSVGETAIYCCARHPSCIVESPQCGAPSTTYACDPPATPGDGGDSLGCVGLGPGYGGGTSCCAPPDTCFSGAANATIPCASPADQYFCTGSATPSLAGLTCTPQALVYGGDGVQGYCCANDDAATGGESPSEAGDRGVDGAADAPDAARDGGSNGEAGDARDAGESVDSAAADAVSD